MFSRGLGFGVKEFGVWGFAVLGLGVQGFGAGSGVRVAGVQGLRSGFRVPSSL